VICRFKRTFLRDLAELPITSRKKLEKLVFEDFPENSTIPDKLDIRKIQGHDDYYRIRMGDYRIGCEIKAGNMIIFYRVKNRKDIYRVFP
jgi:mRNA interferase RelE/StbE